MKRLQLITVLSLGILLLSSSCKKDAFLASVAYVPTSADVTPTATLAQLQQGRTLFVNNCESCHGLPSVDSYTASDWTYILASMVPNTTLSASDAALVAKYVKRGH